MAFRATSQSVIQRREEWTQRTRHLSEIAAGNRAYERRIEDEIREQVAQERRAVRSALMEEVIKSLDEGAPKGVVVKALDISRQTLDRWIKQYEEEKDKP